jgi:hypothetical protein
VVVQVVLVVEVAMEELVVATEELLLDVCLIRVVLVLQVVKAALAEQEL